MPRRKLSIWKTNTNWLPYVLSDAERTGLKIKHLKNPFDILLLDAILNEIIDLNYFVTVDSQTKTVVKPKCHFLNECHFPSLFQPLNLAEWRVNNEMNKKKFQAV